MNLCLCGCGKETSFNNNKKRYNYFIHGHSGRVRSESSHNKIVEAIKRRWQDPKFKEKMAAIKSVSKRKISMSVKKLWEDPNYRDYMMECRKRKNSYDKVSKKLKDNWKDPDFILAHTGPNSNNWKGGLSFEDYCSIWKDIEFKEEIKERDDRECNSFFCDGISNRLAIHHIDYNKKNCNPQNLITLCISCNSKANSDRFFWRGFYIITNNKLRGYDIYDRKSFLKFINFFLDKDRWSLSKLTKDNGSIIELANEIYDELMEGYIYGPANEIKRKPKVR